MVENMKEPEKDKLIGLCNSGRKLYKNYYSKQGGLLSRIAAKVIRGNERSLKKMVNNGKGKTNETR